LRNFQRPGNIGWLESAAKDGLVALADGSEDEDRVIVPRMPGI
jgi:hypothetical protein